MTKRQRKCELVDTGGARSSFVRQAAHAGGGGRGAAASVGEKVGELGLYDGDAGLYDGDVGLARHA